MGANETLSAHGPRRARPAWRAFARCMADAVSEEQKLTRKHLDTVDARELSPFQSLHDHLLMLLRQRGYRKSGDLLDFPDGYFPHALELGALFDFLNLTLVPLFVSEQTGDAIRNYWLSFASGGSPVDRRSGGGVPWPRVVGGVAARDRGRFSEYLYLGGGQKPEVKCGKVVFL